MLSKALAGASPGSARMASVAAGRGLLSRMKRCRRVDVGGGSASLARSCWRSAGSGRKVTMLRSTSRIEALLQQPFAHDLRKLVEGRFVDRELHVFLAEPAALGDFALHIGGERRHVAFDFRDPLAAFRFELACLRERRVVRARKLRILVGEARELHVKEGAVEIRRDELLECPGVGCERSARIDPEAIVKGVEGAGHGFERGNASGIGLRELRFYARTLGRSGGGKELAQAARDAFRVEVRGKQPA